MLNLRPSAPLTPSVCTPVRLEVADARSGEVPRNAAGQRVSIADFDMTVEADGAVVGRYDGASQWSACACPRSAGATAKITARYPAKALAERARVPGVAFESSITVRVVAGPNSGVPIGCGTIETATVAAGRGAAPWFVTLTSNVSAIPIGVCSPIQVDLRDATGKEAPRNPAGLLLSLADFDLSVTAPAAGAVAGQSTGAAAWSACGCQGAAVGMPATITATYPARALDERARVPGVAFASSITLPLAAAMGASNPPACAATTRNTTADAPLRAAAPRTAPAAPAANPAPVALPPSQTRGPAVPAPAPSGLTVTGTPVSATLAWEPVAGVASFVVTRQQVDVPPTQLTLAATNEGMYDSGLTPATTYNYSVRAIQADGRSASADIAFTTPPAVNPAGFTASQTGAGQVQLSWAAVAGASYYVVFGPGAEGGTRVDGATAHTVTNVPVGSQEWAVASYYEPGTISTIAAQFTRTQLSVNKLLSGWVDLHTHPMSHLGFGKKLLHGVPDIGSLVPAGTRNCNPTDFRATTISEALGNCSSTHGGWGVANTCGDHIRSFVISGLFDDEFVNNLGDDPLKGGNVFGDHRHEGIETNPFNFAYWPHQSSKVHQQMWWEWIKRAKELGNLRVMVALTVNSELLAKILNGDSPQDDKASADLQIDEIIAFVGRHGDFMEIAKTPADLRRIVGADKLAVVLGMEVDNIGNFNKPGAAVNELTVKAEIQRLYDKGVRYVFPIHLVDNKFGGTAVYEDLFNFANKFSTNSFLKVRQSNAVEYKLGEMSDAGVFLATSKDVRPVLGALSTIPYPPAFNADPTSPDFCMNPIPFNGSLGCWRTFKLLAGILNTPPEYQSYDTIPKGHVNDTGLTSIGKFAVREMMKLGMMIDIDHMSDKSQADTLDIAEQPSNRYPINMGHNGLQNRRASERIAALGTVKRVAALGGVFGMGTADSEEHNYDAQTFISSFREVWTAMGSSPAVALGTDVNGMERLPRASKNIGPNFYTAAFPRGKTGTRSWDYTTEGVVHYGLMADFVRDVSRRDATVHANLMTAAEKFAQMWEKADKQKACVRSGQPTC